MMASRAREARGGQLIGPWADRAPRWPAPKSKIQFNGADGLRTYISSMCRADEAVVRRLSDIPNPKGASK
jgi:hypothetical protein